MRFKRFLTLHTQGVCMKQILNVSMSYVTFISLALLLSGCGSSTDKNQTGSSTSSPSATDTNSVVLLSIKENGTEKPLITEKMLNDYISMAEEANPQLRMVLEMMPDAEQLIFSNQKRSKVLREWARKTGVEKQADYNKNLDMIVDMARSNLDAQFFQKQIKVAIQDEDLNKYYEEHKNEMPGLLISPEGVKAQGVFFDKAEKAHEFLAKVKEPNAKFADVAKKFNVKVDDFGGVLSERSFIDKKIKEKVLATKKFPSYETITVDKNKYWVIKALSKEKAQYAPFDQVKANIRSMLEEQEISKAFEKEIEKLEKEYGIVENKAFFEEKKKNKEEARKQAEEASKEESKQEQKVKEIK